MWETSAVQVGMLVMLKKHDGGGVGGGGDCWLNLCWLSLFSLLAVLIDQRQGHMGGGVILQPAIRRLELPVV